VLVASALAYGVACDGESRSEGRDGAGGESSTTGGRATGGSGASSGTATTGGSPTAGSNGAGGSATAGSGGTSGAGGSSGTAGVGGTPAAGEGGATGGTSAGGEGGAGNCVDVCALHGGACCIAGVECVSTQTSCTFEVLAALVITFGDYATFEQTVAALPQDLMLSFTDADIQSAASDPTPTARFEFRMTRELALLHGEDFERAYNHPFRVSCNGQPLFVGVFYLLEGAAFLDLPVLHVDLEGDALVLRLGARMGAWPGIGGTVPLEARQRIDRAELRSALCLSGPVSEL
jgi:hypothetical protein